MKAFSVDFIGDMALFKKNDANDLVFTSYNFIHKPVVLGLFGAILGISGYSKSGKGKHPEYYNQLKNLEIAIKPLFKKPLQKVITGFNNATGHANMGDKKDGATWQIREQVLVGEPTIGFRVFVKENSEISELKQKLRNYETTYPLYFGKNEFFAHYEEFQEYDGFEPTENIARINSLFIRSNNELHIKEVTSILDNVKTNFIVFEQLPYDFDNHGFYKKDLFTWTNYDVKMVSGNFSKLFDQAGKNFYVQFV